MIEIALCTDNRYAMSAGVMIYSVCRHTSGVSFHVIIPDDFSEKNGQKLTSITDKFGAGINFLHIPREMTDGFPVGKDGQPEHISIAAYYRLFLGRLLPETMSKVIYLDCDLICLSSLEELWDINLGESPLACVNDIPRPWQHPQQRLGYDDRFPYFNSGVLLINLDYWRKNDVIGDFKAFITHSPEKIQFHDQDVLNYIFHEKALFLPPKFNATDIFFHKEFLDGEFPYPVEEVDEARHNPVIVHFTYRNKPWIKGGSHTYRDQFLAFKKETPWKHLPLKVKKATTIKGMAVNMLVRLGLYRYHDDYISRRRILFIVNPISGGHLADGFRLIVKKMASNIADAGLIVTEHAGHARELALKAVKEKYDIVVAVGGDGTVGEVASSLVGTDTALGIVPIGSGNGLARHLGIPPEPQKAVKLILASQTVTIDSATIGGIPFFCTAGIGFDAMVAADYAKAGTRGLVTYAMEAIKDWHSYKSEEYTIITDEGEIRTQAILITFGNANQWGNNFYITPEASLVDGKLDIAIVKPASIASDLRMVQQLGHKTLANNPDVRYLRSSSALIECKEGKIAAHYDGETTFLENPVRLECIPGSLKVISGKFKV